MMEMITGVFTRNPVASWIGAIIIAYLGYRGKEEIDEARGRRQQARRDKEKSRRVQKQVRENLNEKSTQTIDAVDTVRRRVRDTGELPERIRERFIRPDGNS